MTTVSLPRNTTRQAEGLLYGRISRILHWLTGMAIVLFVLLHVVAQSIMHVAFLSGIKEALPWLARAQNQNWIHAILIFSIVYHTLYGLRLLASDLGMRVDYKISLWAILGISALFGLREMARYGGI